MANTSLRNFVFTWNIKKEIPKAEIIKQFMALDYNYLLVSLEKASTGQLHYQGYCELKKLYRFNAIKKALPSIHFEPRNGTQNQAIDYCIKTDTQYEDGTTIISKYIEDGKPKLKKPKRTDIEDFVLDIISGFTDYDLMIKYPKQFLLYQNKIQTVRNTMLEKKYSTMFRKMDITYLYGSSGSGKSRYVFEKYPNAYKVNSYHSGAFDGYRNENVIVLEEFRGNFPITFLLQLLDGYPLRLPARYVDKQACFTKVFILSNISLSSQYPNMDVESIMALERRINNVVKMDDMPIEDKPIYKDAVSLFGSDIVKIK